MRLGDDVDDNVTGATATHSHIGMKGKGGKGWMLFVKQARQTRNKGKGRKPKLVLIDGGAVVHVCVVRMISRTHRYDQTHSRCCEEVQEVMS